MAEKVSRPPRMVRFQRFADDPTPPTIRVLVADDDAARRAAIVERLKTDRFEVSEVTGLAAAKAKLQEAWSEAVLLDIRMLSTAPDAREANLAMLREIAREPKRDVIVLWEETSRPHTLVAQDWGPVTFLDKEEDLQQFLELMYENQLRRRSIEQEE